MRPLWTLSLLAVLMAAPSHAKLVGEDGEGCGPGECGDESSVNPDLPLPPDDDPVVFGPSMDQPLHVVRGDFDGDGRTDTVQGFPEASNDAGRVDVFWGNPSFKVAWPTVLSAIKDPTTRLARGRLGASLAVGDFNGDGLDDLAIGAPHTNLSAHTNAGSVVIIYGCAAAACPAVTSGEGAPAVGSPLDPSYSAGARRVTPSPAVDFGRFGNSLAVGDFDNDGYDDLAVGAPGDTVNNATAAGSVTMIYGSPSGLDLNTRHLIHQNLLPAGSSRAEADDHFGAALGAARLDLDDDDDDLVVGVPDEDWGDNVNPGEVDVFWGGAEGISASRYVPFRHSLAMAGANRSGDRLGYDLRAFDRTIGSGSLRIPGRLYLGLAEAAACDGGKGYLSVTGLGATAPVAELNCVVDITNPASTLGDGALPEIPVKFIVIANKTASPQSPGRLPTAGWRGPDPITGATISGADYFKAQVELLNQQVRDDGGNPVCVGKDCLRFAYRSHIFYSPSMFEGSSGVNICPKLHAISDPERNIIGEDPLSIAENCNQNTCPHLSPPLGPRYENFSDFAESAVDTCGLLTDDDAFNVIIYDVCDRTAGNDGKQNTADDNLDCANYKGGRGRKNQNHPYAFLDYDRALLPRIPTTIVPQAAEEHEAGHAFGLSHACDPSGSGNTTHIMQSSSDCGETGGSRNLGFVSTARSDVNGTSVVEVDMLVQTAREHVKAWRRR